MPSPADDPFRTVQKLHPPGSEPPADPVPSDDAGTRAADQPPADSNHTTVPSASPANGDVNATMPDGTHPVETAPPPPTDAVPGYEVLSELGRGGMGVVYKARHLKLNRFVALKLMLGGSRGGPNYLIRFQAEAEAVAAIKHPNVVEVYDYGETDGRLFMALEYCSGGSLAGLLAKHREAAPSADSARQTASLVAQVARGVAAAHALGIVHRDLNPNNVFLDAAGVPKVADFGLAKRGAGADVTQAGDVMGTPAYMSPEQARGESKFVGPEADVWGLGVILHEALTGQELFTGTLQEVFAKVLNAHPPAPSRAARAIPRDLDLICLKCLAREPAERYQTAKELADDLERFARGEAIRSPRTGAWYVIRRTARRWWRPMAACCAIGTIILMAWPLPSPLDWFKPRAPTPAKGAPEPAEPKDDPRTALIRAKVANEVAAMRLERPLFDRIPFYPRERKDALPRTDYSAFKVFEDHRVVDLRRWKQLPPNDPTAESVVVYTTQRKMMKIAPANELRIETRTTGRDVINRGHSPNVKVHEHAIDEPGYVGRQPMKVRQLVLDMAAYPENQRFDLKYTSTYLDSLQTPEEQWFGVIGYEGSVKTSMLMLFPTDRPFREYMLLYAPTLGSDPSKREDPQPYTGPVITFAAEDKSWLYWEISNPKANHVYRVDWTW